MEKQEMIDKVEGMIKSKAGYSYDPQIVRDVINSGVIPAGTVLGHAGADTLVWGFLGTISRINAAGETVSMDGPSEQITEGALMTYAHNEATKGRGASMGSPR
jgi:hypothetical protein